MIAVTVTDADGNTASDSAIISGLTIVSVEPTTASGQDANGNDIGYKYVRIFFSEPLSSLDASEIEIRHTKTKQLYSIETVKLSSTGLFADVILYGSLSGDGTTFLQANEPYVATVTHDGLTDSLEFELPANDADAVVVAVNTDKNTIRTAVSGRSNQVVHASTYNLGLSYTGNLGQLLGRTVNYAYNADDEISDFTVQDETVLIDTVKFFAGSDNTTLADDYFKGSDGTKYYLEQDNKSTKNRTVIIYAKDIDETINNPVAVTTTGGTATLVDGTTYNFAKLILNPNGTVARVVLQESVPSFLKVASMSGTTALVDAATSLNFDGYTLFDAETSELLAPADLAANDNVFYSIADKFGYVYNNSVSGELSNVIKEKLDLDGTTYTWKDAKYFDEGSGKYVDLKAGTPKESTASQDYLNSLDPDEVEAQLWMGGNIAFVIGDVVGEVTTTKTRYVMTADASGATVGFDTLYKFPVSDGTTSTNLTVDASKLKSYNGKAGKGSATSTTVFAFDFTDTAETDVNVTVATAFPQQSLVDITTDEDGNVIGLAPVTSPLATYAVTNTSNDPDGATATKGGTVDKDITTVTVATNTFKMNASTNVWIFVKKDATAADSVKKMAFSDYSLNTKDLTADSTAVKVYAATDKAAVNDLVIVQPDKDVTAFQVGDRATVQGFVTDVKSVRKSDGTEVDVLKSVTVTLADGTSATYEGDGDYVAGGFAKGDVVTIEYYKSNEKVKGVTKNNASATKSIYALKDFSNDTLTMTDGFKVVPASDCLIQKKYTEGGATKYAPITVEEITSSNCGWTVDYWAISTEATVASVANFITVADDGSTLAGVNAAIAAAEGVTLSAPTAFTTASTGASGEDSDYDYAYAISAVGTTTAVNPTPTISTDGEVTLTAGTGATTATVTRFEITVTATEKANNKNAGTETWVLTVNTGADNSFTSASIAKA